MDFRVASRRECPDISLGVTKLPRVGRLPQEADVGLSMRSRFTWRCCKTPRVRGYFRNRRILCTA